MYKKFYKNNLIMQNQLRSKLLFKHLYNVPSINSIRITLNLNKLKSFNDDSVLEGLFLLEFLSSLKANVTYYKKMYQEVNLQLTTIVRRYNIFYFLLILKLFYFPLLNRRNVFLKEAFDKNAKYAFTLTDINSFSFLPDVFFKWNIPVNCFLDLDTQNYKYSKLYLHYWNFLVYK